jgi:hypothetical protein
VYSIFNPQKKKTEIKNGIEKFGKNCHLPRLSIITTTNMCIWIFSYMLDGFLLCFSERLLLLPSPEMARKKKQQREEA